MSGSERGAVYCEQAYAQGKMLDNSEWNGLPRKITPSDLDLCFDNNGWLLLCELSSESTEWQMLQRGQRMLYESFVRRGQMAAALLKHSVPQSRQIRTCSDIEHFQVMFFRERITCGPVWPGHLWGRFVQKWYDNPRRLLDSCEEQIRKQSNAAVPFVDDPQYPTAEELREQRNDTYTKWWQRPAPAFSSAAKATRQQSLID